MLFRSSALAQARVATPSIDRAVSLGVVRAAIRAKLRAGASKEAISLLIASYAPQDAPSRDPDYRRVAVEYVPPDKRVSLLQAIERL
jgi:hypothetical protein